jgi:hypothetical protein
MSLKFLRHGKIPSRNDTLKFIDDDNVHVSVMNKFLGPRLSICTPEVSEGV